MYGMVNHSCSSVSPESYTTTMCGCWRRAQSRISRRKRGHWAHHFERDAAIVLQVVRQKHGGHAAAPQLALDAIPIGQRRAKAIQQVTQRSARPLLAGGAQAGTGRPPAGAAIALRLFCARTA